MRARVDMCDLGQVRVQERGLGRDALLRVVDEHRLKQIEGILFDAREHRVQDVVLPAGKVALVVG